MTKCSFCGKEERPFRGVHLIKNTGAVVYFCSSKCRRNALKLKRDKKKVRWTEAFHERREKSRARARAAREASTQANEAKKETKKSKSKSSKK
ncbi:hypothetical protein D6817_00930 [Candidatus Pacearchaeota archaeon]|nr:MAG: hypothetical protein D6817_00930 [Candidatus Pacearchaeota archaeon]